MITRKGRELADKLNPAIGTTSETQRTCSLIARHATTYQRIQEMLANGGTYGHETRAIPDAVRNCRIEEGEAQCEVIEARIADLVRDLPETDDGPFGVIVGGDPRGCCTVKITAPGLARDLVTYDHYEGICVPQEASR
jgi:hypothetical protein